LAGGGAVVVVVVVGVGGVTITCATSGGAVVVVVAGAAGATVVVAAGTAVVEVEVADEPRSRSWKATRCDGRFTASAGNGTSCDRPAGMADDTPWAWADSFCSKRRGTTKSAPQMIAATPRRLP